MRPLEGIRPVEEASATTDSGAASRWSCSVSIRSFSVFGYTQLTVCMYQRSVVQWTRSERELKLHFISCYSAIQDLEWLLLRVVLGNGTKREYLPMPPGFSTSLEYVENAPQPGRTATDVLTHRVPLQSVMQKCHGCVDTSQGKTLIEKMMRVNLLSDGLEPVPGGSGPS